MYKRVSASPVVEAAAAGKSVSPTPGDDALSGMRRDATEEAFEFFARLQSAWEDAVKEGSTSWSGGDMRKHFCYHVGQ